IIRVSLQWREPHDPQFLQGGEDLYRTPLAQVRLVVLRQRDPSGTKVAADDMEVVAISPRLPQRLDNYPQSASYEQTVEFLVPTTGRYALRVEATIPPSIRPPTVPTLPPLQQSWEFRPRIFVTTLGEAAGLGRAIFLDYATD